MMAKVMILGLAMLCFVGYCRCSDSDNDLMLHLGGMLFFDDEDDFDNPACWVKITVDVDEYRFMADAAFKMHFRMSSAVFEALVAVLGRTHKYREDAFHTDPEFDLAHVLLMVLWILATPDTFRSVALRFGKTPGVLHYHYINIINTLAEMSGMYIRWANQQERARVARSVERRTGMPGVVGAIDGSHIQIYTPEEGAHQYLNRHHDHSIVLQAVADETLLFRDIYVGQPGGAHDSRVFRRSPLCSEILENPQNYFSRDEHLLGDGAYTLLHKLLTPFRNLGNLTLEQLNYNRRLASARVVVERAFGLLKGKWRRLQFLTSKNLEYAVKNVVACAVLHNFILLEGDGLPLDELEADIMNAQPRENIHLLLDDDIPLNIDHPNVPLQQDHPLMANARQLGAEKRRDIVGLLPPGNM